MINASVLKEHGNPGINNNNNNPIHLKALDVLIIFHYWHFTIGPKLDFWRIFEIFGFAVLVLKLPTLRCFEVIFIPTF